MFNMLAQECTRKHTLTHIHMRARTHTLLTYCNSSVYCFSYLAHFLYSICVRVMLLSMFQLRIVKLAQSWNTMRALLNIIFGAFSALIYLSGILVIIIFIFAVLGNQLLGSDYSNYENLANYPELEDYGGELPRYGPATYHNMLGLRSFFA